MAESRSPKPSCITFSEDQGISSLVFPYGQIFLFVSLLIEIQSGVLLIAPFSPTMGQETAKRRARRQTAPPKPKQVGGFQSVPDESKSIPKLENELEFSKWYNEVEDGLLEASYGEYQYGLPVHILLCFG